ncbi:hypothetical protein FOA52_007757 [Chlamydomonas sp. UWO 241]|nr:hypothetical protein FOA52_007757 [Chlamydomonas sp. UWO 241]
MPKRDGDVGRYAQQRLTGGAAHDDEAHLDGILADDAFFGQLAPLAQEVPRSQLPLLANCNDDDSALAYAARYALDSHLPPPSAPSSACAPQVSELKKSDGFGTFTARRQESSLRSISRVGLVAALLADSGDDGNIKMCEEKHMTAMGATLDMKRTRLGSDAFTGSGVSQQSHTSGAGVNVTVKATLDAAVAALAAGQARQAAGRLLAPVEAKLPPPVALLRGASGTTPSGCGDSSHRSASGGAGGAQPGHTSLATGHTCTQSIIALLTRAVSASLETHPEAAAAAPYTLGDISRRASMLPVPGSPASSGGQDCGGGRNGGCGGGSFALQPSASAVVKMEDGSMAALGQGEWSAADGGSSGMRAGRPQSQGQGSKAKGRPLKTKGAAADGANEGGVHEQARVGDNDMRYELAPAELAEAHAEGERQANNPGHVTVLRPKNLGVTSAKRSAAQVAAVTEAILIHAAEMQFRLRNGRRSVLIQSNAGQGVAKGQSQGVAGRNLKEARERRLSLS